jgi:hypothetical protein
VTAEKVRRAAELQVRQLPDVPALQVKQEYAHETHTLLRSYSLIPHGHVLPERVLPCVGSHDKQLLANGPVQVRHVTWHNKHTALPGS